MTVFNLGTHAYAGTPSMVDSGSRQHVVINMLPPAPPNIPDARAPVTTPNVVALLPPPRPQGSLNTLTPPEPPDVLVPPAPPSNQMISKQARSVTKVVIVSQTANIDKLKVAPVFDADVLEKMNISDPQMGFIDHPLMIEDTLTIIAGGINRGDALLTQRAEIVQPMAHENNPFGSRSINLSSSPVDGSKQAGRMMELITEGVALGNGHEYIQRQDSFTDTIMDQAPHVTSFSTGPQLDHQPIMDPFK